MPSSLEEEQLEGEASGPLDSYLRIVETKRCARARSIDFHRTKRRVERSGVLERPVACPASSFFAIAVGVQAQRVCALARAGIGGGLVPSVPFLSFPPLSSWRIG